MRLWMRWKPIRIRLLLLLSVIGPGIITANVDNDAGGITTYSVAGAHFGNSLLWMLPLVALALILIQEMSARLGVVTGKGLADLIRESLGHPRHGGDHRNRRLRQHRQHRQRIRRRGGQHGNFRSRQICVGSDSPPSESGC